MWRSTVAGHPDKQIQAHGIIWSWRSVSSPHSPAPPTTPTDCIWPVMWHILPIACHAMCVMSPRDNSCHPDSDAERSAQRTLLRGCRGGQTGIIVLVELCGWTKLCTGCQLSGVSKWIMVLRNNLFLRLKNKSAFKASLISRNPESAHSPQMVQWGLHDVKIGVSKDLGF